MVSDGEPHVGASSSVYEMKPRAPTSSQRRPQLESDVEGRASTEYSLDSDPYQLSARFKSDSELAKIQANTSRKRDGFGPVMLNRKAQTARQLRKFYEAQNENITRLLTPVDEHVRTARETANADQLKVKIATWGSFGANLALAVLQVYAASSSLSLSLFTTMADALFDPLSNVTLILCNKAIKSVDARKFPSGKARIETVGNIMFCFLMAAVSWILIVVSIIQVIGHSDDLTFHVPSVIAVGIALLTKFVLFCYCWTLRKQYSQIEILWEDHRNDLFINGFGLFTSIAGSKLNWLWDPVGAICLAVLISTLWLRTAYKEFQLLIGISADTEMLQWITYICESVATPLQPRLTLRQQ